MNHMVVVEQVLLKLPQDLLSYATGRDGRMMGALTDRGFAEKVKGLMAAD